MVENERWNNYFVRGNCKELGIFEKIKKCGRKKSQHQLTLLIGILHMCPYCKASDVVQNQSQSIFDFPARSFDQEALKCRLIDLSF